MEFNKTNSALAAGFTGAIVSLIMHILMKFMFWGGMTHMRGYMMHMGRGMQNMTSATATPMSGCPMMGWGIIAAPIIMFFVAGGAGWLFAFFYNKLGKK
jgi:hypothetical protein